MTNTTDRDTDADRASALRHAASRTERRIRAERDEAAAFAFAARCGASLREIENATGVPHMTVKRRIQGASVDDE